MASRHNLTTRRVASLSGSYDFTRLPSLGTGEDHQEAEPPPEEEAAPIEVEQKRLGRELANSERKVLIQNAVANSDNEVACPKCEASLAILPEYYNERAECAVCGTDFMIRPPGWER